MILQRHTPFGRFSESLVNTPTVYIYGRNKGNPQKYTGSKFAFKLNEFLEDYCDQHGYSRTIRDNKILFSPSPASSQPSTPKQFNTKYNLSPIKTIDISSLSKSDFGDLSTPEIYEPENTISQQPAAIWQPSENLAGFDGVHWD